MLLFKTNRILHAFILLWETYSESCVYFVLSPEVSGRTYKYNPQKTHSHTSSQLQKPGCAELGSIAHYHLCITWRNTLLLLGHIFKSLSIALKKKNIYWGSQMAFFLWPINMMNYKFPNIGYNCIHFWNKSSFVMVCNFLNTLTDLIF